MQDPLIHVQTHMRPAPPTRLSVNWQALVFWSVYLCAITAVALDLWVWRP